MKRSTPKIELQYVEYLGEVGCGQSVEAFDNVVPFIPKSELVMVALPSNIKPQDAGVATVRGLSLTDFNVFDGDRLLFRTKFQWREIGDDTVCVVLIHATGELVAKRIEKGSNRLILKASGGGLKDMEYGADEVEVKGIVIGFLIDAQSQITRAREAKRRQTAIGRKAPLKRIGEEDFPF